MEQSSLESQATGCAKTPILTVIVARRTGLLQDLENLQKQTSAFSQNKMSNIRTVQCTLPLTSVYKRSQVFASAHGGHETTEVWDVRRTGGGGGRGRKNTRVDGVFPGRPQSFRYQRRPVDEGRWHKTAKQRTERFMAKLIAAEKARTGLRHARVCPDVMGRTEERITQSKRARAGSLTIID